MVTIQVFEEYSEDISSCIPSPRKIWNVFIVFSVCILTYASKT